MHRVAELAHEAAKAVADEHGVGLVVIVVDATERVQYQSNLGPTMTAGAFARCACLYDCKPRPPELDPGVPHGLVIGGGITTHGPGGGGGMSGSAAVNPVGGGAGVGVSNVITHVISDPPGAGGEGRR